MFYQHVPEEIKQIVEPLKSKRRLKCEQEKFVYVATGQSEKRQETNIFFNIINPRKRDQFTNQTGSRLVKKFLLVSYY
jgi:hypothetical protein